MADRTRTVRVDVVPHTHWDREWYSPFPTFRLRLLDLLDELLPRLTDGGLDHFQLDGQMAVVDDYLGMRPQEAGRLRELARSGRITVGPWYVLPDEFLVSGETHIRNLQLGLRRAEDFGGAMQVGYLPDMFGHIAQMPQILRQFGFSDAVVWRGVPSSVDAPAFWWEAPDGSMVRATYLPAGYGNGSELPADPEGVRERIDTFRAMQGPLSGDPVLLMAGMDHEAPPAHLARVIAELNDIEAEAGSPGDDDRAVYELTVCSLSDHLSRTPSDGLPTVHGEMRSGHRANVLMGVTSNRVDVKQAAARAERTLERIAEPLAALWLTDPDRGDDPRRWAPVFDAAWLDVIRNAAHDSICACSHDDVVAAVLHRYAESTRLAEGVADRAAAAAASRMGRPGAHILNPTARGRSGVIELDLPGAPTGHPGEQVLSEVVATEEIEGASGEEAPMRLLVAYLAEHPGTRAVRLVDGPDGTITAHLLAESPEAAAVGHESGDPAALDPGDALAIVGQRAAEDPSLQLRLVLHRADASRRALVLSPVVPGYGWSRWEPVVPANPVSAVRDLGLGNGLITVEVDPLDGTFSIDGVAGFGRLIDEGDCGDTYNWCPPEHDVVVDVPSWVRVTRTEDGPIRGRLVVESCYLLPERCAIDGQDDLTTGWAGDEVHRRVGEIEQVVRTTIEIRADDPTVRVDTAWDQRARDHRLRVHLPLLQPADHSEAEDAYAVVRRGLWVEGGPSEWGVPTFPSRRFVRAGGVTVAHEGLCEYELVDLHTPDGTSWSPRMHGYGIEPPEGTTASTLALTLVRSTAWLSRGPMPSRPLPAGPFDRLEGAEALVPLDLRYAIAVDAPTGDPSGTTDAYAMADAAWNPLLLVDAPGGGDLADSGSLLEVSDAEGLGAIEVDAVLRDDRGRLVVRAHPVDDRPAALSIPGRTGAVVDLRGREIDTFTGRLDVDPHRIVTVRVD